MSDAAENLDKDAEEGANDEPEQTSSEDIAREGGWKPKDEWEGPPGEWRSAEVFNERGEWIKKHKAQDKRLNEMETQFNTRLDNSNKLHKAQMETQKAELVRKRDAAIDLADRDTANQIQGDIDNLVIPEETTTVNTGQSALDAWNQANPWVFQAGPKAAYAQSQLNIYMQSGNDVNTCLANVDADIAREFPDINHNRDNHPIPEGGSKPGGKRAARLLTMADLTNEELSIYKNMPGTWESEAVFLKAVQDGRD